MSDHPRHDVQGRFSCGSNFGEVSWNLFLVPSGQRMGLLRKIWENHAYEYIQIRVDRSFLRWTCFLRGTCFLRWTCFLLLRRSLMAIAKSHQGVSRTSPKPIDEHLAMFLHVSVVGVFLARNQHYVHHTRGPGFGLVIGHSIGQSR